MKTEIEHKAATARMKFGLEVTEIKHGDVGEANVEVYNGKADMKRVISVGSDLGVYKTENLQTGVQITFEHEETHQSMFR